jgi:hypothetical protein
MLGFRDVEFLRDKRQGDASHQDDETFNKFARSGGVQMRHCIAVKGVD